MKKTQIILIAVALLGIGIVSGYFYSEYRINQVLLTVEKTKAYETQVAYLISEQLTAMPTITPQPTFTATVTPTQVPVVEYFTSETSLFVYKDPRFDSDIIGNLGVGESAVWAEERKDYSNDPNWNWYHIQFVDVEKSENELYDGYVAVLTEHGRQITQDTCPALVADSFSGNSGFIGGAGRGYAVIQTNGYTLGKITTTTYNGALIDSVNALIVQSDPSNDLPVLIPFNLVIGVQFPDEELYYPRIGIDGAPLEECMPIQSCGLDHISQFWNEETGFIGVNRTTQNREFVISRFENKIIYGRYGGGGDLGTEFNYYDQATFSYIYDETYTTDDFAEDPISGRLIEKFYRLFSKYEVETSDNMNLYFLRGKTVPSDWLNMGFGFTRYIIVSENEYGENLTQCLQAIGSN